jgi:hypothetical protein
MNEIELTSVDTRNFESTLIEASPRLPEEAIFFYLKIKEAN